MYKGKNILSIIPARGGSKGLPGKNILSLLGKPLIGWTIEQALKSRYLDKVVVSTDDHQIARIAKEHGADVPFMRPKELGNDDVKIVDVLFHVLDRTEKKGSLYDIVLLLQPTSPCRVTKDIDDSVELLFEKNAGAVVSVCEVDHHPYWSNTLPDNLCLKDFLKPEIMSKNRQELPIFYRLNGAIYLANCKYLREKRNFYGDETYAYLMPRERSIDIDSEVDFRFAEFLLQENSDLLKKVVELSF